MGHPLIFSDSNSKEFHNFLEEWVQFWIRGRGVNQACVSTYDYFFELISRHSKNFYTGKESFNEVAAVVEPTGWNISFLL